MKGQLRGCIGKVLTQGEFSYRCTLSDFPEHFIHPLRRLLRWSQRWKIFYLCIETLFFKVTLVQTSPCYFQLLLQFDGNIDRKGILWSTNIKPFSLSLCVASGCYQILVLSLRKHWESSVCVPASEQLFEFLLTEKKEAWIFLFTVEPLYGQPPQGLMNMYRK